jgi:4-carboxymuconolactone decarboxylase
MASLPYPDEKDLDARARKALDAAPFRINLFRMLAHAPALIGPTLRLGQAILSEMTLDPRLRELAILRAATLSGTDYERYHHETVARLSGIPETKIAATAEVPRGGPHRGVLDATESLVTGAVDEILTTDRPSGATMTALTAELGATSTVELILTVGYYTMLGQLIRAVNLELDASPAPGGAEPWDGGRPQPDRGSH